MWSRGRLRVAGVVGIAALGISAVVTSFGPASAPRSIDLYSFSSSSSSFSDHACSASGATATRVFAPYGAVANITTDNTSPIQRAINAAASAGGGVVVLPAGTFLINGHLILKNNVKLTGVGPTTVLKAGPKFLDCNGPGWRVPHHHDGRCVKRNDCEPDCGPKRQRPKWKCRSERSSHSVPRRRAQLSQCPRRWRLYPQPIHLFHRRGRE